MTGSPVAAILPVKILERGGEMKYYSEEYLKTAQERVNSDPEFQKRVAALNFVSETLVTDCPGGVDRLINYQWERGRLASVKLEEKPAPSDWRKLPWDESQSFMRAAAPYDAFAKVNRGEMTAMEGMMKGIFRMDGDMSQVMPLMPAITAFTELLHAIPCEY